MEAREIERLVETYQVRDLEKVEESLIAGKEVEITMPGENPGEKLAYIAAAKWIVEKIKLDKCEFQEAYEAYLDVIKEQ